MNAGIIAYRVLRPCKTPNRTEAANKPFIFPNEFSKPFCRNPLKANSSAGPTKTKDRTIRMVN